ncbi:magnesium transporter [Thermomicrobium sp.]|uniref:magnesium transporter n=1 Tax=Thermomicrobium sp. TaxID=1969469 RepID=UPI001B2B2801|nr:magnesium transporter [Thermomicrobium sp.]MBO9306976.1 magnesium transporter [Thermomicrobium sp.]MBO9351505.1 magnesium transporter [Thermomicrobium sp.]
MDCRKLLLLVAEGDLASAKTLLNDVGVAELVACLRRMKPRNQVVVFRLLDKERALEVFESLTRGEQRDLVQAMEDPDLVKLFAQLDTEEQVRLFEELPAKVVKRVTQELPPESRQAASAILGYPEGSAGRVMNPDYLALPEETTVAEALEQVSRSQLPQENLEVVFVLGPGRLYRGYVPLAFLLKAAPQQPLKDLAIAGPAVSVYDLQDRVAELFKRHQYPLIAVVDREKRLVGAIDAQRGLELVEAYEAARLTTFGGILPAGGPDIDLLSSPLHVILRARVIWLAILTLFGVIASNFVAAQEAILTEVIILAAFIAPIIDMGGNTGSQAATLVIRSLALGQIRPRLSDYLLVFRRELPIALGLGVIIAILEALLALVTKGVGVPILAVVGTTMLTVTALGGLIGSALPFLARRLGFDPATLSGPVITSIMDILGLLVYFSYATIFLRDLLE